MNGEEFLKIEDKLVQGLLLWFMGTEVHHFFVPGKFEIKIYKLFSFYVKVYCNGKKDAVCSYRIVEKQRNWNAVCNDENERQKTRLVSQFV